MKKNNSSEYKQLEEMRTINKFIVNLKKNKKEYAKLVFLLAITIPKSSFAATNDLGLGSVAAEIIQMVMVLGKYGCLAKGTMCMVQEMLQGANLKESLGEGIQYFVFYIVLNLYPRLFNMIKF